MIPATGELPLEQDQSRKHEAVYLLHGFAGRPLLMSRMARYLSRANYQVHNWGYSGVLKTVADHAAALGSDLERVVDAGLIRRVHFVSHSLGGIIIRQMLTELQRPYLGRVVMLAPPNTGSHVASLCSFLLRRLCPILQEISTKADSYVNQLQPPLQAEIGVIAASRDWVVRRKNTHLATQKDHIVVRGDHIRLPLLRVAAEQTLHFLETGSFLRDK